MSSRLKRTARYLAPNLLTGMSVLFGLTSLAASHSGNWALAGWMIIYAVLSDRLDGLVARYLHATSALGMQLDSLADFLNFGVAPAFLSYCFLTAHPSAGFATGASLWILRIAAAMWVWAAAFRLGRYNATSDEDVPTKIFFGVPTTLAGGLVVMWFLLFLKYETPTPTFGGDRLLGLNWTTPAGSWWWLPCAMVVFAYLMISSHPMPKSGLSKSRAWKAFLVANLILGYVGGFLRMYPEILVVSPTLWVAVFLVWGQFSKQARGLRQPSLFPQREDVVLSLRHQEDIATPEDFGEQ